ncbi:MAG: hypothetical protein M3680_36820 [Myxococcota bacterium]|nr:hypothetical protein [Myxococcota bacterium]
MKGALGLSLGGLCAVLIACAGGARPRSAAAPGATPETSPLGDTPRSQIDALDRQIDEDLATLQLARPATPIGACVQPPCDPQPMATAAQPPQADPSCRPGPSELCKDSCRLADSICTSAARICDIAAQLGGNDAYANGKCASGTASCDAARTRCCGC